MPSQPEGRPATPNSSAIPPARKFPAVCHAAAPSSAFTASTISSNDSLPSPFSSPSSKRTGLVGHHFPEAEHAIAIGIDAREHEPGLRPDSSGGQGLAGSTSSPLNPSAASRPNLLADQAIAIGIGRLEREALVEARRQLVLVPAGPQLARSRRVSSATARDADGPKLSLKVVPKRRRTDLCMRTPFPLRRQESSRSAPWSGGGRALPLNLAGVIPALYPLSDSTSNSHTRPGNLHPAARRSALRI